MKKRKMKRPQHHNTNHTAHVKNEVSYSHSNVRPLVTNIFVEEDYSDPTERVSELAPLSPLREEEIKEVCFNTVSIPMLILQPDTGSSISEENDNANHQNEMVHLLILLPMIVSN
jgi:hypothetical protein